MSDENAGADKQKALSLSLPYDNGVHYDPETHMVTLPDDTQMTAEQYRRLIQGPSLTGSTPSPSVVQGGRRAGANTRRFLRNLDVFKQIHMEKDTVDKAHLTDLLAQSPHRVVVWQSKGRYTYAAVNAGDWYITGTGDWYGKNQFTPEEFINDVVTHDEVTSIYLVTALETLWSR